MKSLGKIPGTIISILITDKRFEIPIMVMEMDFYAAHITSVSWWFTIGLFTVSNATLFGGGGGGGFWPNSNLYDSSAKSRAYFKNLNLFLVVLLTSFTKRKIRSFHKAQRLKIEY